jgi:class 3 adenylate cyclase
VPEQEWIDAGLLDPDDDGADARRELLRYLEGKGVTVEEMVAADARGGLHAAAGDRRLFPRATLTIEDVAGRTGLTPEQVSRAWLAAGFPPPPPGEPAFTPGDLAFFDVLAPAQQFFGADNVLAFTRVMGGSMARIAEAAESMFLSDVEAPHRAGGATDLELARAIDDALGLLEGLPKLFEVLFVRHATAAVQRSRMARLHGTGEFTGADRLRVAVGFADLVGYTELSERVDRRVLAAAVGRFEQGAADRAVAAGARMVKSIGDAVMVVGVEPLAVVDVMLGVVEDVAAEPTFTGVRAAVVAGEVLARDGDFVGATVNLAARATKEAPVGRVVVNEPVAAALAAAGRATEALEPRLLRGIDETVTLSLVGS